MVGNHLRLPFRHGDERNLNGDHQSCQGLLSRIASLSSRASIIASVTDVEPSMDDEGGATLHKVEVET